MLGGLDVQSGATVIYLLHALIWNQSAKAEAGSHLLLLIWTVLSGQVLLLFELVPLSLHVVFDAVCLTHAIQPGQGCQDVIVFLGQKVSRRVNLLLLLTGIRYWAQSVQLLLAIVYPRVSSCQEARL